MKAAAARAPELAGADPSRWARACSRGLRSRHGEVVVSSAELLAALRARRYAPEVAKIYAGYLQDARFAAGPGRDPVGWYDRLGAAAKALE